MLKALAFTLMVATFLASGFTFAPAEEHNGFSPGGLAMAPLDHQVSTMPEVMRPSKTGREDKPHS